MQVDLQARQVGQGKSLDEHAVPELDSEAPDFRVASECFAQVRKLKRADLETLRPPVPHPHLLVPSIGGVPLLIAVCSRVCLSSIEIRQREHPCGVQNDMA